MAKQVTLNATKNAIKSMAAEKIEGVLKEVSQYAVSISPVDTGAYVTSFSIGKQGFGGGRARTSHNKPKNQNPEAKKQESLEQLYGDIASMRIKEDIGTTPVKVTLRNRSPHANIVEDGRNWKRRDGYYVFTKVKRRFG